MNRAQKIAKIRVLAERGATEGERAAARSALERLGEPAVVADPLPPSGVTGMGHVPSDLASFIFQFLQDEGLTKGFTIDDLIGQHVKVSTKPSHRGRVSFERD